MELPSISNRRQKGFSLLEALIALVVFSVALLGIAGMYAKMMSMSHSSYLRTLATIQVNDFEERLRANPLQKDSYEVSCGSAAAATGYAGTDLAQWCANNALMFGGLLTSATVVESGSDYEITMTWNERGLTTGEDGRGVQDFESVNFIYRVRK